MKMLLKAFNVFIILSIASFAIFLNGCDQQAVDPTVTGVTINGKVGDEMGNALSGLTVTINGSNASTAADGSFAINNITVPYDVKIYAPGGIVPTGIFYSGISTITPVFFAPNVIPAYNTSVLTVNIPSIGANQRAMVYFTDGLYIENVGEIASSNSSTFFTVRWPGSSTVTGKVIVLVYTKIGAEIISYNNYGEKSGITLTSGTPASVTFSSSEMSLDPGETAVSGTITQPSGYSSVNSKLELTFRMQGSNENAEALANLNGNSFSYLMPTGLTSSFRTLIYGGANGTKGGAITYKASQIAAGSSGNNLILDEVPALTGPTTTSNIDTTTSFTFVPGTGSGVNMISYTSSSANFYVFTNNSACTIPNFSANGLGIGSAVTYQWNVVKLSGISNTNNMASGIVLNNPNLVGTAGSEMRSFTTVP